MIHHDIPDSENREGWLRHPHTAELKVSMREQAKNKAATLRAAARRSADPEVVRAVVELEAVEAALRLLEVTRPET